MRARRGKRGIAWRGVRGRFVCGLMLSPDSWLEPLRGYPRELVLACAVLALAGMLWVAAKVIKWSIYALALAAFAITTVLLALWLWE